MQNRLSREDRQFIADQIEPITNLPLKTAEDDDAWLKTTRAVMQRLSTRFPDIASVVPHELYHYFDHADIHRKEPSYPAAREKRIIDFIRELRQNT
jgi:predicted SprT family Zn-dependent metalloprotease